MNITISEPCTLYIDKVYTIPYNWRNRVAFSAKRPPDVYIVLDFYAHVNVFHYISYSNKPQLNHIEVLNSSFSNISVSRIRVNGPLIEHCDCVREDPRINFKTMSK